MDTIRLKGGPEKLKNVLQGAGYAFDNDNESIGIQTWTRPPTNYAGTALFLSYIAAALALTFFILFSDILPRWRTRETKYGHNIQLLSTLALLSFSLLSYNMISFLVQSFLGHLETTRHAFSVQELWSWMYRSNLFTTFARSLLVDDGATAWSRQALAMTIIEGAEMSFLGMKTS
jgi:hypothetical protein